MKLNPPQAPLYGECVLTVQLDDNDVCHAAGTEEGEEVEFYLLFSGSTQRHVSSTLRVSHLTLQAACPAHNVCEQVLVTLCLARPDRPVATHSQEAFCFVQDLALDMARFLLDTTAPQEALLFVDEQIPLKECERLDHSLALALKHLSMSHHRAESQTPSFTYSKAHAIALPDTHAHMEASSGVTRLLDSCNAVSQNQQLSNLLHLAASRGLRTVASFLLQQPGAREALRTTNAQGKTPACVAQGKGHEQLVELFTQYETSSDIQVEPKEQLHWHQESKVFQHHANLGTHTLTFSCWQQSVRGSKTNSDESCCVHEEVEELRRLIQLHRNTKGESYASTPTAMLVSHDCELQLRQHKIRHDAYLAVVTTENCSTITKEQGSPLSLKERTPSAALESVGGQRNTAATKSSASSKKKNKKKTTKTTKHATTGNNRSTLESSQVTAQSPTETTETSCLLETEGTVPLRDPALTPALTSVIGDGRSAKVPTTEETLSPINPVPAQADDGKCTNRKATTAITEKQERQKWEVDMLMCEQALEEATEQADNLSPSTRQDQFVELTEHGTGTMGQEQSQDPHESQSDPKKPNQPETMCKSPKSDSRTCPRSPDTGGWIGSIVGSLPLGSDTEAKSVWYQGENVDQGASELSNRNKVSSQTVWYYDDDDERKYEQLEQTKWDLSSPRFDKSPSQLLEQGLSSHQMCSALSQPHGAGSQPAPSHGLATQRQEVQGLEQEEEVGPDWQEGGEEGGSREVWNRATTCRKNSDTTNLEEGGEEKPGGEEKEAKGRKKRRKKKGKRGSSEAKLSSSSSIESQTQNDAQTEQVTKLKPQSESEAKDQTGRAHIHSPTISEPTRVGEEADKEDTMHLPSQSENQTRDNHKPDCALTTMSSCASPTNHGGAIQTDIMASQTLETKDFLEDENVNFPISDDFNLGSIVTASELSDMNIKTTGRQEINPVQPKRKDAFDHTELDLKGGFSPTLEDMELKALSQHETRTAAVTSDLVDSKFPKDLPVKNSEPTELAEDLCFVLYPEENTQSDYFNKPVQPVDLKEKPVGFVESAHPTQDQCLPCEGAADVIPPHMWEGNPETPVTEYLESCLSSKMHRDLLHKEKKRHELFVGKEEAGKEAIWRRTSEKNECRVVNSKQLSSVEVRKNMEFPSLERENVQKYNDDLVIAAVAVVTVAVSSAMASVELSQHLAGKLSESPEAAKIPTLLQYSNVPTENQSIQHSHAESTDQFNAKGQADGTVSDSVKLQCKTEIETPGLSPLQKEELQLETTHNKPSPCLLSEEDKLLQVNMNPLPETNDLITAEADRHGCMQTQIQLPCPLVDTGQSTELPTATLCPDSKSKQDQIDGQLMASHVQNKETHTHTATREGCLPLDSITGEAEEQRQAHELDIPENSESKTKESNGLLEGFPDTLRSDFLAEECESNSQLLEMPHKEESHTLLLSCSSSLCVLPPVTDPASEELTAPTNMESVELQSRHSLEEPKLVAAIFQSESDGSVAVDDVNAVSDKDCSFLDTVDGWKHRERKILELEKEATKDQLSVQDISHREAETLPPTQEASELSEGCSNSAHTLQIRREKDFCYPGQPYTQTSTETSCIDVHPDRDDGVSVCVLQRDCESLKGTAALDESVFKKPYPPSSAAHGDKGVHVSTDYALMQGDIIPSEGASRSGTANSVAPQNSGLSWKPETSHIGGGLAEGGRKGEEEKKAVILENAISSAILQASVRSLSPLRRHSWEPGQSSTAKDADITQHSQCVPSPSPLNSLSGEAKRAKPPLHRRSMSWCPSNPCRPDQEQKDNRSYSLERPEVQKGGFQTRCPGLSDPEERTAGTESQDRGSLISLTEEEQEGDAIIYDSQATSEVLSVTKSSPATFHRQSLTKSISMVAISHCNIDVRGFPRSKRQISFSLSISPLLMKNRRFFSIGSSSSDDEDEGGKISSFSSNASALEYSISEEEPGPLRNETEGKVQGPKISRTFSYLRSKMSKKSKEKEKRGDRERESKEREKKAANGHLFIPVGSCPSTACQHCTKLLHKETFLCNNCGVHVHKSCRESLSSCTKSKTKFQQQLLVPESGPGSAVNMRSKSTSSASSVSSTSLSSGERWSTVISPDDQFTAFPWRPSSILNSHSNLAKSVSISNIAGLDDAPLKGLKFLSQSTDNLHHGSKVNASTESLIDEGTEMIDSQLMGEFECDIKDLEADSWSGTVDKKFLKTLKKDEIKRQDVIYELYQTEFHHVRTLKIMSEVYYKGLQKDMQLDTQTLEKIFPVLDDLLDIHAQFLTRLLEAKRASSAEGRNSNFLICHIGNVLVTQFSDSNADQMKKVYGKFCSRHNEAVNLYKDLHAKDKRFQAFIKKTMSSSIVRRLSIPECILLVTQRITKYPVLMQRIFQHTKDSDEDHSLVCESLRCVKQLITAVDSKVNEHEKKRRLREVYSRTDSKSIMRMKSGQMFAKEDLIRGRKLLHDGALQLKNSAGRLKDVHAMLLSDVLVFLQEKDQKYVFASLDQRSTVISLQNLIVREVANEERGLFLITAGTEQPEMVEVLASCKEERNTWRAIIQDAMHSMEKDEDEGVPSETEEDRRQQENRAKEIREILRRKDEQIISLLEEKVNIFRELSDCNSAPEDMNPPVRERMLFRATPDDVTKGEPIIKDALREVESLHALVNRGVCGAGCSAPTGLTGGSVGPVCLPRRAETFGGFDSHQMNSSKHGEKEEGDESLDLRRTESDSVLKKGAAASLQMLLKRNNEQVQQSVAHLHDLLISLQAIVVQQDSFIEDQRQALNDRLTVSCSRHSSSSSLSSSSSSRPSSLIEQEKHRSLERQRQEAASLQKQQAAHQEERRKREKEWEQKERVLGEWEDRLREEEEETRKRHQEVAEERESLQRKKEEFQREMERMKDAQKKLDRDKETLKRDTEQLEAMRKDESKHLHGYQRTPSTTSEESIRFHSSGSLDLDSKEAAEPPNQVELSSSAPNKEPFLRIGSKRMSKNFNPFSSSKSQGAEKESQLPTRLLQIAKPKEKKDKKKKKGKGGEQAQTEAKSAVMLDPQNDGDIYFC